MQSHAPTILPTPDRVAALDRLGDEIALLSAHLDAATARLLSMIREFDARGGWNTGFRSCAAWLSWRVGLETVTVDRDRTVTVGDIKPVLGQPPAGQMHPETPRRGRLLSRRARLFLGLDVPPAAMPPELGALHAWLDTWHGIGLIAHGLARQNRDLSLTRYATGRARRSVFVTKWRACCDCTRR